MVCGSFSRNLQAKQRDGSPASKKRKAGKPSLCFTLLLQEEAGAFEKPCIDLWRIALDTCSRYYVRDSILDVPSNDILVKNTVLICKSHF